MIDLQQLIRTHLPTKTKQSSQGWLMFDAQCCHHRGHKPDRRMRGNLIFGSDGQLGHNCYNCGFKFKFDGITISDSFETWLTWIGVDSQQLQRIKLQLLARTIEGAKAVSNQAAVVTGDWPEVDLPGDAHSISSMISQDCDHEDFQSAVQYLRSRCVLDAYNFWYSTSSRNQLNKRVIVPFFHKQTVVGWTARYVGTPPGGVPRYWNSSVPAGYLFNQNVLSLDRNFVLVVEGPFDAIAVQGVSPLGSTMSDLQIQTLLNSNQEPIVLPDRTRTNQQLIDLAVTFGWSVSFPEWEDDVKDAAEARKRYGEIYTITSALASRTKDPLTIGIKRKLFKG